MDPISVIDLNNKVKDILQYNDDCKKVCVTGMATNVKLARGHLYLTLKDDEASVSVAFWNCKLKHTPNNGDNIIVWGSISVYNKLGTYQLSCYAMNILEDDKEDEVVDLYKLYEDMGYFNNKISLPKNIRNVGLITSKEGAAINDFKCVLQAGNFKGNIYFVDTIVQGVNCPNSVVTNLQKLSKLELDVIVITRGGGSKEDLMGFSSPLVLDAIHNAPICVISAIGHENDTMFSDLVADVRAATPSVAGELICKSVERVNFKNLYDRVNQKFDNMYKQQLFKLNNLFKSRQDNEINYLSYAKKLINNKLESEYKNTLTKIEFLENSPFKIISNNSMITSVNDIKTGSYNLVFPDGNITINISLE